MRDNVREALLKEDAHKFPQADIVLLFNLFQEDASLADGYLVFVSQGEVWASTWVQWLQERIAAASWCDSTDYQKYRLLIRQYCVVYYQKCVVLIT